MDLREHNRFFEKVRLDASGCWLWTAACCGKGYGRFGVQRGGVNKTVGCHRLSYETFRGDIPGGYQIHHVCGNRACVNPAHLECVTAQEHVDREPHRYEPNRSKTHCKNGHEYTDANTRVSVHPTRGWVSRHCRSCEREWKRAWKQRQRRAA